MRIRTNEQPRARSRHACGTLAAAMASIVAFGTVTTSVSARPGDTDGRSVIDRLELPDGFKANLYAKLDDPRFMVVTPDGDILVTSPEGDVLRVQADKNGDGRADGVETVLDKLDNPSGIWLDGKDLYVAEENRIVRTTYDAGSGKASGKPEVIVDKIPTGGHSTRTIKKGPDGAFYITVGSSCNVCAEKNPWRAAMLKMTPGKKPEIYATGLRNTVGFDWRPGTEELYGVDNGRDMLGDDVPPEDVNRIEQGGFYGWPNFHGDNVPDPKFGKKADPDKKPIPPVHEMGAHQAPLSMHFLKNQKAPGYENTALVGLHGSWNRSTKAGYRVISLHWAEDGAISERPFLSGFEQGGDVVGRPVDVIEAPDGTIFVSDDEGGAIWRISYEGSRS